MNVVYVIILPSEIHKQVWKIKTKEIEYAVVEKLAFLRLGFNGDEVAVKTGFRIKP